MFGFTFRATGLFVSVVIACYGLAWTAIEVADYVGTDLQWLKALGGWANYLMLLHSLLIGLVVTGINLWISRVKKPTTANEIAPIVSKNVVEYSGGNANGRIVLDDLQRSLSDSLKAKRFDEVIRIGKSLSRPLLISGNFKDKVTIGKMVEEAAASIGRKSDQMAALIDDVGWPSVELGDLDGGEKYLKHGLNLAKELNDSYYKSIAYRHLGAIYRRRRDYTKAGEYFGQALDNANNISNANLKAETVAGAQYAFASLSHHTGLYDDAITRLSEAIALFKTVDDTTGQTRATSKLAGALLAKGDIENARDLYRQALNVARANGQRHQIVKCLLGLAKISINDGAMERALEYLADARSMAAEIHAKTEFAEIVSMQSSLEKKPMPLDKSTE